MSDTNPILIQVPLLDSRSGKTITVSAPIADAQEIVDAAQKRMRNAATLAAQFESVPSNELPHLIVVFKGRAAMLATVSESSDDAVKRALNAAIGAEAYPVPPPKRRSKTEK